MAARPESPRLYEPGGDVPKERVDVAIARYYQEDGLSRGQIHQRRSSRSWLHLYPGAARQTKTPAEILCPACAPTLHRKTEPDGKARDRTGATCPNDFGGFLGKSASSLVSVRTLHMGSTPGASTVHRRGFLWETRMCSKACSKARESAGFPRPERGGGTGRIGLGRLAVEGARGRHSRAQRDDVVGRAPLDAGGRRGGRVRRHADFDGCQGHRRARRGSPLVV